MNLYQFHHNDIGTEHLHVVAAETAAEAVRAFVADYRGVHADDVVMHRNIDCVLVYVVEQFGFRQVTVEWDVTEIEIKAGVLI